MRKEASAAHDHLLRIVRVDERDREPWGKVVRWEDPNRDYPKWSGGCKWYVELEGEVGFDWGVCTNLASHRCGLLTFEHQGCEAFEAGDVDSYNA
jgi:hypothetical protein